MTDNGPPADRPRWPAELAAVHDELDALFRTTPLLALLGVTLLDWGPGWARTRLETVDTHANLAGSVHGGVLFALADAAFEVACNAYGRRAVALETTCHYSAPAPLGASLVADAAEVSRSHRTASYRLEVRTEDGGLCAAYLALAYRTSRWHVDSSRLPEQWRSAF
ncbi:MAG: hotdog fold thioesterase [Euzebyaceae bacterium]|nr:hotdog fold thioesterase [Euzebyaceae bacterium]